MRLVTVFTDGTERGTKVVDAVNHADQLTMLHVREWIGRYGMRGIAFEIEVGPEMDAEGVDSPEVPVERRS